MDERSRVAHRSPTPTDERRPPLHTYTHAQRRATMWFVMALGAIVLLLASASAALADEPTEANPNNYQCFGHITAGKPEVGSEEQQVAYSFACNGPITGYQLESNVPVTGFSSAPVVTNEKNEAQPDSLSCSGEFPGWAVNCVGATKTGFETISGQFSIDTNLCVEPRVDPILTVAYASGTGTYTKATNSVAVTVTQALAGPFDLGRPHGCPAPKAFPGGTRLDPAAVKPKSKASNHKKGASGKAKRGQDKSKNKSKNKKKSSSGAAK